MSCGRSSGVPPPPSPPCPVPTTTLPVIPTHLCALPLNAECGMQWYSNVPSSVNRKDHRSPGLILGESSAPPGALLVTVWKTGSSLIHVTVVPFVIVRTARLNAMFFIDTVASCAGGVGLGWVSPMTAAG